MTLDYEAINKMEKNKKTLKTLLYLLTAIVLSFSVAATTISDTGLTTFTYNVKVTGAVEIAPTDTSTGLLIDQNYDGVGINIDSEATTGSNPALNINTGIGNNIQIGRPSSSTSGTNWFYRDDAASAGALFFIEQDNAADNQEALSIQQDGIGVGAYIDQNGNNYALRIDSESTTNTVYVTGKGSSSLAYFEQEATADATVISIKQNSDGVALYANQDGNGVTIDIDSEATNKHAITGNVNADSSVFRFGDATSSSGTYYFERNVAAAATNGPVAVFYQNNAGDDQNALRVINDGANTALYIQGGSCAAGQYGLYENSGNLYYCYNGVQKSLYV